MFFRKSAAICLLAFACCFLSHFSHAHTYRIPVLVDTDMALDDMRAIAMLLNSHMADIPLIVVSDGISSPEKGLKNLEALLSCLGRNDIRVAVGKKSNKPGPPCRGLAENTLWPGGCVPTSGRVAANSAIQTIAGELDARTSAVIYLCLGPMTNLAGAIRLNPEITSKISRIVYFGDHPDSGHPGWNTKRDPGAARLVFSSGIDIYCIHPSKKDLLPFDRDILDRIDVTGSPAARLVSAIHRRPAVQKAIADNRLMIWDETAVIYLENPGLFKVGPADRHPHLMRLKGFDAKGVSHAYTKCLGYAADAHLNPRHSVVLKAFPHDPAMFKPDVAPHVNRIIHRHGIEEWKATVLTNEFHRHLGIYSLIGAKMGIRAREILGVPFDTMKVLSHAGNKPPISCMNDGLQVSTGASLGRGTIKIDGGNPRPAAAFFYRDKTLTLSLNTECRDKIKQDIKAGLNQFGGLNRAYFAHIRKLSIRYWLDFNRAEIFNEELAKAK